MKLQAWFYLKITLRIISGFGAFFCFYLSLLKENEDGEWQHRFEKLWVKIDDLRKQAISRHVAIARVTSDFLTSICDRLFGKRLFSIQAVGVSCCLAVALFGIAIWLLTLLAKPIAGLPFLSFVLTGGVLGLMPAFLNKTLWIKCWFIGVVWLSYNNFVSPFIDISTLLHSAGLTRLPLMVMAIPICLFLGLALFVLLIAIIRKGLLYISATSSSLKIGLLYIGFCFPAAMLIVLWKVFLLNLDLLDKWFPLPAVNPTTSTTLTEVLSFDQNLSWGILWGMFSFSLFVCIFFLNSVLAALSAMFVIFGAVLVIHHFLWPLLDRPIYSLQKLGITKRPKVIGYVGVWLAALALALGKFDWLEKIVDKISP